MEYSSTAKKMAAPEINWERPSEMPPELFDYDSWSEAALCEDAEPDMYFTEGKSKIALTLCRMCPVSNECLISALVYDEKGVWGGTTEDQRDSHYQKGYRESLISRAREVGMYRPKPTTIYQYLAQFLPRLLEKLSERYQ